MADGTVGVVVLNHNGGDMTMDCLGALRQLDFPQERLRIVLVDNASHDNVVERVAAHWPDITTLRSPDNVGFAAGCNLAIRHLGAAVDYVALLNNDAVPEPGWLTALMDALEADPHAAAATSKLLFDGSYADVTIEAATTRRRGDRRALGVGVDMDETLQFVSGWFGPESTAHGPVQWSSGHALLRARVTGGASRAALIVRADRPKTVLVRSGPHCVSVAADAAPRTVDIPLAVEGRAIVNNAGCALTADAYGVDRGWLLPDGSASVDRPADVFGWSGGAVLLRRAYLDDVGLFDERYFMYYEDLDLSWRGRAHGWHYLYVPSAVVRHRHAATAGAFSAFSAVHRERNRLLTLVRNAPTRLVWAAFRRYLTVTASYAYRDVVVPLLSAQRPRPAGVMLRLRAAGSFARTLPSGLAARRRLARRGRLDAAELEAWLGLLD